VLKLATIVMAASFVIASAAFTVCHAQTMAVSEQTFDWIFFAIVGIPFILVFVVLLTEGRGQIPPNRMVADKSERSYPPLVDWK
jgi:bacteriorhodopsin